MEKKEATSFKPLRKNVLNEDDLDCKPGDCASFEISKETTSDSSILNSKEIIVPSEKIVQNSSNSTQKSVTDKDNDKRNEPVLNNFSDRSSSHVKSGLIKNNKESFKMELNNEKSSNSSIISDSKESNKLEELNGSNNKDNHSKKAKNVIISESSKSNESVKPTKFGSAKIVAPVAPKEIINDVEMIPEKKVKKQEKTTENIKKKRERRVEDDAEDSKLVSHPKRSKSRKEDVEIPKIKKEINAHNSNEKEYENKELSKKQKSDSKVKQKQEGHKANVVVKSEDKCKESGTKSKAKLKQEGDNKVKAEKNAGESKSKSKVKKEMKNTGNNAEESKSKVKIKKEMKDTENLNTEEEGYEWWKEAEKMRKEHPTWKWNRLSHNGVLFPPEYVPHNVKMLYDGKPVYLNPDEEEAASMFAKHLENQHGAKKRFCENFFEDFKALLDSNRKKHNITKFELCDFIPILDHLKEQAEIRKARSKEEKEIEKQQKLEIKNMYGYALVNGHKEPLGNYMVEPPSLFLGRGDHPKTGKIKKRIYPEQITLNLSEDSEIPVCPIAGHKWGNIVHNHEVAWIATWTENIVGLNKYVLFGASSSIRGSSDRKKFEVAHKLMSYIETIRKVYTQELISDDIAERQRATAMWVIDNLALRVGNEKSEDQADTVGCCSLRVEHTKLHPPNEIELDFLGKDSMRYHRSHKVPEIIYNNFQSFIRGKKASDEVFDHLKPTSLNRYLNNLMPELSAKVFRTYNASITLQQQLEMFKQEFNQDPTNHTLGESELKLFYNRANRQVAILCNHQKTVSKSYGKQMVVLDQKIEELKDNIQKLEEHLKNLKSGKHVPSSARKQSKSEKSDSRESDPENKNTVKALVLPDDPEKVKKKITSLDNRLKKLEISKTDKDEGSEIQNSTSKINYMDPRISIVWCNKVGLDVKKIFSKTLLAKFRWAIAEVEENPDYCWKKTELSEKVKEDILKVSEKSKGTGKMKKEKWDSEDEESGIEDDCEDYE